MMKKRYDRNRSTISEADNRKLAAKRVCVAGCGGLGGGIIEGLVRIGIGTVVAVDADVFDETNLNRQVLSNEGNIGASKAAEAAAQMRQINSQVRVIAVEEFIDADNVSDIIRGADAVVDALDNIESRKLLEAACETENIPLIHGAVAGWYGQLAVIMPGDRIIETVYDGSGKGEEESLGNPYFTPAVISAMEVSETVKLLLERESPLRSSMLTVNLLEHHYEIINFGK